VEITNRAHLPAGFDLARLPSGVSGWLVRSLLRAAAPAWRWSSAVTRSSPR